MLVRDFIDDSLYNVSDTLLLNAEQLVERNGADLSSLTTDTFPRMLLFSHHRRKDSTSEASAMPRPFRRLWQSDMIQSMRMIDQVSVDRCGTLRPSCSRYVP